MSQPPASHDAPPLTGTTKAWYGLGQFAEGLKNEAFSLFLLSRYRISRERHAEIQAALDAGGRGDPSSGLGALAPGESGA